MFTRVIHVTFSPMIWFRILIFRVLKKYHIAQSLSSLHGGDRFVDLV